MPDESPILKLRRHGQVLVVTPRPDVGLNEDRCIDTRESVEKLMTTTAYKDVIIDLTDLREINSYFLGSLTALLKLSKKNQGSISLAAMHEYVAISFKVSGLTKIFDVYETVEDAVGQVSEKIAG